MLQYNKIQLKQFYLKCQKDKIIGLDTEFHRVNTYYPKLCLVQISNKSESIIIDPLKRNFDISYLNRILFNKEILKIIHASRQDIEIFYNLFKKIPQPLFDTQLCLFYLGYNKSISYAKACNDFLCIKINKEHQFIDWRQRPLSLEKINYAINDVKYLIPLYEKIRKKLEDTSTPQLKKELKKILDENLYKKKDENAWQKINLNKFDHEEIETLKYLCAIREKIAKRKDIPVKRIIRDQDLKVICNKKTTKNKVLKILNKIIHPDFRVKAMELLTKCR